MIMKIPGCWPVILHCNAAHWRPNGTQHGPKSNPRLIAASLVTLCGHDSAVDGRGQFTGCRLWVYLRGGYAFYAEAIIDRRSRQPRPC